MEYFFADRIWNNTWDILPSGVKGWQIPMASMEPSW